KFPERKMEPMLVTIEPNKIFVEKYSHPGEEFYYVIKGMAIYKISDEESILNEGDSIHCPSKKAHDWKDPLDEKTVLLSVLTPLIFRKYLVINQGEDGTYESCN